MSFVSESRHRILIVMGSVDQMTVTFAPLIVNKPIDVLPIAEMVV
jgi:hypothetical protein